MSDMKCPHCGEELVDQGAKIGNEDRVFACENISCAYYGQNLDLEIWQDLIAGQKAQDRLEIVKDKLQQIHLGVETSIDPRSHAMTLVVIQSIAEDALKIIAPITKQDTKEQRGHK